MAEKNQNANRSGSYQSPSSTRTDRQGSNSVGTPDLKKNRDMPARSSADDDDVDTDDTI